MRIFASICHSVDRNSYGWHISLSEATPFSYILRDSVGSNISPTFEIFAQICHSFHSLHHADPNQQFGNHCWITARRHFPARRRPLTNANNDRERLFRQTKTILAFLMPAAATSAAGWYQWLQSSKLNYDHLQLNTVRERRRRRRTEGLSPMAVVVASTTELWLPIAPLRWLKLVWGLNGKRLAAAHSCSRFSNVDWPIDAVRVGDGVNIWDF